MEAINHPEEVLYLTDVYRQRSEYAISKLSDIDGINIPQAKAAITQGNSTVRCGGFGEPACGQATCEAA
ncbi:hypothetical protein A3E45_00060 [Candidatus Daviesbacteria bacterium RIFCSPHIGHO2_12_FULL_43_11]|uniref:Uncharacterized protein n=1 Tax=Candidatus Daviesbacteria bacterium RIFCSPHIGHO2_12_FULL_43_11 TaxID=1797780 RepID=A0A1F5K3Y4_9BACT|nr:MAG: hypothetical protein A3E45_00060 [Candidatus Daviesbacteria bacterium RIFCSPHIGHO2_12_FULL_43_11]